MPSTRNTPQFTYFSLSPVTKYWSTFADGVVMPSPDILPVASLSGQARIAIRPTSTAVTKGCHRFSNNIWLSPVRFAGRDGMATPGLRSCLMTSHSVSSARMRMKGHTDRPNVSGMEFVGALYALRLSLTGSSTPDFIMALIAIYPNRAIQLPIRPSPARYHVPVAQPRPK